MRKDPKRYEIAIEQKKKEGTTEMKRKRNRKGSKNTKKHKVEEYEEEEGRPERMVGWSTGTGRTKGQQKKRKRTKNKTVKWEKKHILTPAHARGRWQQWQR